MFFKVFGAGMIVLFLAACAVQYNDPDPIRWCAAYGSAGVLTAFALAGKHTRLTWLAGSIYLVWALWNMPKYAGDWFHIEEGRESLGLTISAVWMAVLAAIGYRAKMRDASPPQN